MTLEEARAQIDQIDPKIRELFMQRMDASRHVAEAKFEAGSTSVYRADREAQLIEKLGAAVPPDRRAQYTAVLRKIMEASRMYQYSLLYDWNGEEAVFSPLAEGISIRENGTFVKIRLTRQDRPNAMSSILSMIGDYGYNMKQMELLHDDKKAHTVTFELTILGDLSQTHMKKLMFQLSRESLDFHILEAG